MEMNRLTKPRFVAAYLLAPLLFFFAHTTERQLQGGVVLVGLGALLRLWANGHVGHVKVNWTQSSRGDTKIGELVTAGPYAFVRHPLYLGSFLIGLGFGIVAGRFWLMAIALGVMALIYHRKIVEEETTLSHEWGEAFERYRQAVPRYLPTWRPYSRARGSWDWKGIWASREWKTTIWAAVLLVLLYVREEVFQEGETFFGHHLFKRTVLVGGVGILVLCDLMFELLRRRMKRVLG